MRIHDFRADAGLLVSAVLAVAAAAPVLAADKYVFGICQVARPNDGVEISPTGNGNSYLYEYHRAYAIRKEFTFETKATKVILLKAPAHGEVTLDQREDAAANAYYHYIPNDGYVGQDRFAMQVGKDGVNVRIEYMMEFVPYDEHTTYIGEDHERHALFCKPDSWKISQSDFDAGIRDYAAWQSAGQLSTLLAPASQSLTDLTELAGTALAQTIGEGPSAQTTLDPDAAGHGWYVDSTPHNTGHFLPTSKPDVWQAKPGSTADRKGRASWAGP